MTGRTRVLITALLALVVVATMVGVDVVTLTKAKPSFDRETRAFNRLLHTTSSTTLPESHPATSGQTQATRPKSSPPASPPSETPTPAARSRAPVTSATGSATGAAPRPAATTATAALSVPNTDSAGHSAPRTADQG